MSVPPSPQDQQFLALLVHRGFLDRKDAVRVLERARDNGFESALGVTTGWDANKVGYLRRTKAMQEPQIPGYRMERKLGAGGTSEVFGARTEQGLRKVALKVLLPRLALDPVAVRRFLEEAKLLQRLQLQGVVRGHRVFRFLGTYVMEMDWVPGRTLEEFLADGEIFVEEQALGIVVEVARALGSLRTEGLVHRDLKPGNIMIDPGGRVTLIDLGFAGSGLSGRSDENTTLGTPAYLAPEQARGQGDLDARADIYSLGATLYHLVVGKLPFQAGDDQDMLRAQILEGLNGSALKGRSVSPSLHYFIEKMMAKDREVRYASAEDLIDDIEAHRRRQQSGY